MKLLNNLGKTLAAATALSCLFALRGADRLLAAGPEELQKTLSDTTVMLSFAEGWIHDPVSVSYDGETITARRPARGEMHIAADPRIDHLKGKLSFLNGLLTDDEGAKVLIVPSREASIQYIQEMQDQFYRSLKQLVWNADLKDEGSRDTLIGMLHRAYRVKFLFGNDVQPFIRGDHQRELLNDIDLGRR